MALTDTIIRTAKPHNKSYKMADEKGMFLYITPAGSKLWRLKFRFDGKEKLLSLGAYPDVNLKNARASRDDARKLHAIARCELLVLDDWGISPFNDEQRRDMLEVLDVDCLGACPLYAFRCVLTKVPTPMASLRRSAPRCG